MSLRSLLLCAGLLPYIFATVAFGQTQAIDGVTVDPLPQGSLLRMGSLRLTHSDQLTCVRFSPDDRCLGTADSSGVVRLWEVATGKLKWEKPEKMGSTFAFSPDGKILALAGLYEQQIVIWDLQRGERIRELPQQAQALEFSKDGSMLAAAGRDKIARLWDAHTGKLLKELRGHQYELLSVSFSPDGRSLASAGGNTGNSSYNEIRLWDTTTGQEKAQLKDDHERFKNLPDAVYALKFSPDGKVLGAAGAYVVRLWNVEEKEPRLVHRLNKCSFDVAFSPVAKRFVASGDFGIYGLADGEQISKLDGKVGAYGHVDYSHDGKLIASGNMEGCVQLWDAETGKEIIRRSGHESGIRSVAFSPDGTVAASLSRNDSTIRIWGMAGGAQLLKIPVTWRGSDVWWNEEGSQVLFTADGREILTWTFDSTVRYWRLDSLESRTLQLGKKSSTAMAFSNDHTRAAVVEYDGGSRNNVGVYELDGGTLVATLDIFGKESSSDPWVSSLAFSPDGKMLAVGVLKSSLQDSPETSVQLWNLERVSLERRLRPALAPPGAICFSPDGTLLATSAVRDSPLQLWRVSDGQEVRSLKVEADAHGRDQAPMAFSPDSKRFAAADVNREIGVWELATGAKIRTFQGHQKAVTSVAFSPDGKTLLSGSEDATMLLWDISGGGGVIQSLTPKQMLDYWDVLADADAENASSAAKALLGTPQQAVEFLEERLTPGEVQDLGELPKLISELIGDDVKANLSSASRLKSFGSKASPALFKALSEKPEPVVRKRIEAVLQSIGRFPIPPETLQRTRAIQLLEQIGSPDAEKILKKLADTQPPTTSSLDAKAALQRLEQRLRAPRARLGAER